MRRRSVFKIYCLLWYVSLSWSSPVEPRLTLAEEWNSYYEPDTNGKGSYTFGYDLDDPQSANVQYRVEEKYPNGTVIGSYGLLEPDGNIKVVKYRADEHGYRVTVEDSKQKYARHHPPITSRKEGIRDLEAAIRTPQIQGLQLSQFGSQSVQEIRTPPKYQDMLLPKSMFNIDTWSSIISKLSK